MKGALPEPPATNGNDDALSSEDASLSRGISNFTVSAPRQCRDLANGDRQRGEYRDDISVRSRPQKDVPDDVAMTSRWLLRDREQPFNRENSSVCSAIKHFAAAIDAY
jgi:hypothetical protein